MFQHIKIKDYKGIEEVHLRDLGKLNVICGRNNSGKSTILRSIHDRNCFAGKDFHNAALPSISNRPTFWYSPTGSSMESVSEEAKLEQLTGIRNFRTKYVDALRRVTSKKQVWFEDEYYEFNTQLEVEGNRQSKAKLFETIRLETKDVYGYEFAEFAFTDRVCFIPPKRQLETSGGYVTKNAREVRSDGFNLLSDLYFLKNQKRNSAGFRFFGAVEKAFAEVTSGHTFNITREDDEKLNLRFSFEGQQEIEASDCGLGLQDLIIILFFALSENYQIVLLEEPENHMHPEMQRRLLRFLSEETDKQYFITTHSNVFLNSTYVDKVFFSSIKDDQICVSDATSTANVMHSIGCSVADNLVSDFILLVEGSTDRNFMEEFFSKLGLDAQFSIKIWILGGDEMVNQDLSVLRQDYEVAALIDLDPQSDRARTAFEQNCRKYGIAVYRLNRYSIESYISVRALNKVFNEHEVNLPEVVSMSEVELARNLKTRPIWEVFGATDKRKQEIKKMLKRRLREIAKEMTLDEIKGTDLNSFFVSVEQQLRPAARAA